MTGIKKFTIRSAKVSVALMFGLAAVSIGLAQAPVQTVGKVLLQTLMKPPGPADEFNVAAIQDAQAAAAVIEAQKKIEAIQEYHCSIELSGVDEKKMTWSKGQTAFRRPNLAFEHIVVEQNQNPTQAGQQQWTVCDGMTVWQFVQNAPGSERVLMERYQIQNSKRKDKNLDKKGKDKGFSKKQKENIQKHMTPQARRYDVGKLQQSEVPLREIIGSFSIHSPWSLCDPRGMKLESENEYEWVFTAAPSVANPDYAFCRLTIDKASGLARKIEKVGGQANATLNVTDLYPNPAQRVDDKYFRSPFPPTVETPDATDALIAKAKGTANPAPAAAK